MSYHHSHRQLSVLTHLDLPVEAHCRSSFLVDSSRLVQYPLPLCASVSSHCTAWLLLNLMSKLVLLGLVEFVVPPGL